MKSVLGKLRPIVYLSAIVDTGFHSLLFDVFLSFGFQCTTSPILISASVSIVLSLLWCSSHQPDILTLECPELKLLLFSIEIQFLDDLVLYYCFQIHPYTSFSQMYLFSLKFFPNSNVQLYKYTISTTKTLNILLKPISSSFPFQLLQLHFSFVWVKNCGVIRKYSLL